MTRRPIARTVVAVAVLMLGGIAAWNLPLGYTPEVVYPEILVTLHLPDTTDPEEVTRRYWVEIESAIQSLGSVTGTHGRISADGGRLLVRFEPGTDPERKAARLQSDLAMLRAGDPRAVLTAWPIVAGAGDRAALLAVVGPGAARRCQALAEEFRSVPGVRDVIVYGATTQEERARLRATGEAGLAARARGAVARSLATARLGPFTSGGRTLPVLAPPTPAGGLGSVPLRAGSTVVSLSSVASLTAGHAEPRFRARFDGEPAVALSVLRDPGARLLPLDRALRDLADRIGVHAGDELSVRVIRSEADALRRLLSQLGLGLAAAVVVGAAIGAGLAGAGGALRLAAAPPLALAAGCNVLWLAGLGLNAATLPALALGAAVALPLVCLRLVIRAPGATVAPAGALALCAAAVPVAVALGGGELGPLLGEPARVFALTAVAAAPLSWLLGSGTVRRRSPQLGRGLRGVLRVPPTVMLLVVTAVYVLMTLFGKGLDPRSGSLSPDRGRLLLRVSLPEGATLDGTEEVVRRVESRLDRFAAIESHESLVGAGRATVVVEVRRRDRRPDRLSRLKTALRSGMPAMAATIEIEEASESGGTGLGFRDELEDRAATDEAATFYRFVLRSTDAEVLRSAYARVLDRAGTARIAADTIRPSWGTPSILLELRPRPGTSPAEAAAMAAALRGRSIPPEPIRIPGPVQREWVIVPPGAPERQDDVPQRADLLGAPLPTAEGFAVPASLLRAEERVVYPSIPRQSGRFVLSVFVWFNKQAEDMRRTDRENLDRAMARMPLPPGCDLERPSLAAIDIPEEDLRLAALATIVPLLLFSIAAFWLNSLAAAIPALLPGVLGIAAAAPALRLAGTDVDEMTFFSLAAVLCGVLPAALLLIRDARERAADATPARAVYRTLRATFPGLAAGAAIVACLLAAGTLGADGYRDPWVGPLRSAALTGGVALASCGLVLPAALLAAMSWRRRDPARIADLRRPPGWREAGADLTLSVRSLTKVYAGGVQALADVTFELRPGIVGLLGPNGAGKTTLLRLMTGLLGPTRGTIRFRGAPVIPESLGEYRRNIGFLPQEFNAYPGFSAVQFLELWALERGMTDAAARRREIDELISLVGLAGDAERKVRDYSGGMRQRIGIARALLGAPPVLIVDEPTTGLDVEARGRFREVLLAAAGERIVILSTHIASDVEATASRLLLLHRGRIRFDGTAAGLVRRARGRVFETLLPDAELREFGRRYRVTTRVRTIAGVRVRAVAPPGEPLPGIEVEPGLEEAYLAEMALAEPDSGARRRIDGLSFLEEGRPPRRGATPTV